jgi:proteasome accessory factor BC
MSHDTDKLIRQLSLVAFLMAERRALTARDIKSTVEGYSEMSDEAFARRFYSDRAELHALGVPLSSERDEFTGEELYTLRSERYFLPELDLEPDELAALQTALFLLDGQFAYAEPLRLALQNLALGRHGFDEPPSDAAERVQVVDPEYSPEMASRLSKLEGAISKQRTVRFNYRPMARDEVAERTLNPYALFQDQGAWYVVGLDLEREAHRTFRVSRIRSDIRFATRRERDFRTPQDFDIAAYRDRPPWQIGEQVGEARVEVHGDTAWWVERTYGGRGRVEDGVFATEYASLDQLVSWVLRQDGRAVPAAPAELRDGVEEALRLVQERHEGEPPEPAAEAVPDDAETGAERPAGPVAPERFAVLQALLAYLLDACGEGREAWIPAAELVDRFHIPLESLEEHLSLLNLVNFGGGCYAVYAELRGDDVHVDKELLGDTFRAPPRLTPLEARAIRLALDFVGPTIAADAHTPLDRVRHKLEETFGEFDLAQTPEPQAGAEADLVATLTEGIHDHRLVDIEYLKVAEQEGSRRVVEPYSIERSLPFWYVHTWDRTAGGERSFRLDRMREATLRDESFAPRESFEPRKLRDAGHALIWYSDRVARWEVERGARELVDGSGLRERPVGSEDWLVGEILSLRGEAVLLEPAALRERIAARAAELRELLRVAPAAKA